MNRKIATAAVLAIAGVAGIGLGSLICDSISCRDAIGVLFGRGHLLALIDRSRGVYESDLQRAIRERRYASDDANVDPGNEGATQTLVSGLVANARAEYLARHEMISNAEIDRELSLVRFQFRDTGTWVTELAASHLSHRNLRSQIAGNLRAAKWLEWQLSAATKVSEAECVEYFNAHQPMYFLPARYRASHLFLAAPKESPPPIADLKFRTIDSLSVRISHAESLAELVGMMSEDEATKLRGGDLGFFSEWRMPSDFFAIVTKMRIGEISPPVRTALGFHIIQLTDARPARQLTVAEAAPEIRLMLENAKRRAAIEKLARDLEREIQYVANP